MPGQVTMNVRLSIKLAVLFMNRIPAHEGFVVLLLPTP
jgi:hypothetical protein